MIVGVWCLLCALLTSIHCSFSNFEVEFGEQSEQLLMFFNHPINESINASIVVRWNQLAKPLAIFFVAELQQIDQFWIVQLWHGAELNCCVFVC